MPLFSRFMSNQALKILTLRWYHLHRAYFSNSDYGKEWRKNHSFELQKRATQEEMAWNLFEHSFPAVWSCLLPFQVSNPHCVALSFKIHAFSALAWSAKNDTKIFVSPWILELCRWNFTGIKYPWVLDSCRVSASELKYSQTYENFSFIFSFTSKMIAFFLEILNFFYLNIAGSFWAHIWQLCSTHEYFLWAQYQRHSYSPHWVMDLNIKLEDTYQPLEVEFEVSEFKFS